MGCACKQARTHARTHAETQVYVKQALQVETRSNCGRRWRWQHVQGNNHVDVDDPYVQGRLEGSGGVWNV